jgi:hypothetical protein
MAAKKTNAEKAPRKTLADFDPRSIEPFEPFTVKVEDREVLRYLAIAAARDAFVSGEAPASGPEQARAALVTAMGRHMALWDYAQTGGPKARPGSRIAYAPLDPTLAPERQAVKDAAALGMSILPD